MGLAFSDEISVLEKEKLNQSTQHDVVNENDRNYHMVKAKLKEYELHENNTIRIYNVGQGNCIYIRSKNLGDEHRILFDIGMQYTKYENNSFKYQIEDRVRSIANFKPNVTILSHWDMDHLLGVYLMETENYAEVWIAPDYNERKINKSIQRLANYLSYYRKLYLIGSSFNNKMVYESANLSIFKGKTRESGYMQQSQLANNHGLILLVKSSKGIITILPGDCEYSMWSDDIWQYLGCNHNLVVPHHCSQMPTELLETNSRHQRSAIISVGRNTYNHPNGMHKNKLQQLGYDVIDTITKKWIDILPDGIRIQENI